MVGIKGRSGRKSGYEHRVDEKLGTKCAAWLLDNFDAFDIKTQLRVSLIIAPRMVTQRTENESKLTYEHNLNLQQEQIYKALRRLISEGVDLQTLLPQPRINVE